jgi:hypothetical protein
MVMEVFLIITDMIEALLNCTCLSEVSVGLQVNFRELKFKVNRRASGSGGLSYYIVDIITGDLIYMDLMRNTLHIRFSSWLLLVVMLFVAVTGGHESAHAMQGQIATASDQASPLEISPAHHCPSVPLEQHSDHDGCDTCVSCSCHTPLTIQSFNLSYNPFLLKLNTFDQFKHIPEVYLSKFIPPQISA